MAEEMLHDVEGVFDGRAHRGFGLFHRLERSFLRAFGERLDRAALGGDLPVDPARQGHDLRAFFHAGVAGVGVRLGLRAAQQGGGLEKDDCPDGCKN